MCNNKQSKTSILHFTVAFFQDEIAALPVEKQQGTLGTPAKNDLEEGGNGGTVTKKGQDGKDDGKKGHEGKRGDDGKKGHEGDKGKDGKKGHEGGKGDDGKRGHEGGKGNDGKKGHEGGKGNDGKKGHEGGKGNDGKKGHEGGKGNDGKKGHEGGKGNDGKKGHEGGKGNDGKKGHEGGKGNDGKKGHEGGKGDDGKKGHEGGKGNVAKGHDGKKGGDTKNGNKEWGAQGQDGKKGKGKLKRKAEDGEVEFVAKKPAPGLPFSPVTDLWKRDQCARFRLRKSGSTSHGAPGHFPIDAPPGRVRAVRGDGNCYFRAISVALSGCETYYGPLRSYIMQFIGENDKYFDYLTDNRNKNMQNDKVWATDREIFATASMLGVSVWVYGPYAVIGGQQTYAWQAFKPITEIPQVRMTTDDCIYLVNHQGVHYNYVCSIKE